MHTFLYFNTTLSDFEISQLAQVAPLLHTQTNCRCPPSHPIARETTCLDSSGTSQVSRVNSNSRHVSFINDDSTDTWWQSELGIAPVNVTVSLNGLRAALLVAIRFRSVRPQAMVLYYSSDGGLTFMPRQYYASNCSQFGLDDNGLLTTASDVNCVTSLGDVVVFRVLDAGNRPNTNLYRDTSILRDFSLATHVRLELVDWDSGQIQDQYFSIAEVLVGGEECVCNGHADSCSGPTCNCQHDTTGTHCDECLPLFNNEPWQPGISTSANQCEMCECNNHSSACVYSMFTGTGECINCTRSTTGSQCELCLPFFYHPQGVALNAATPCLLCDCDISGVVDDGTCTSAGANAGQCNCKAHVTGRQCDACQSGFYNLTSGNPEGCLSCDCNAIGTTGSSMACDRATGQCNCKDNVEGRDCSSCVSDHYGLENQDGCLPCDLECNQCSGPGPANCRVSGQFYMELTINSTCETSI